MDVREKLVGLIEQSGACFDCFPVAGYEKDEIEKIASHLISHGVTVQEMDGCKYCKEDNDGYRTMFGSFSIANPCRGNVWTINTGHCKPRQIYFCPMCGRRLPQPPKGE